MLKLISRDWLIFLILLVVIIASTGDILTDIKQGVDTAHIIQETFVLILATIVLAWMLINIKWQHQELESLKLQLSDVENLADKLSEEDLASRQSMSAFIARQFNHWKLSNSEKEIGLLLLKGLSLKEIALLRNTAEKTVRQQASAIYQKADVTGRHAFSAWFIEDFL